MLELLQQSLDLFAIEIGRRVAVGLLDDEVQAHCGPRHQWGQADRKATRHGRQPGYVCIGGQKISIQRPRVRSTAGAGELSLERYAQLQQPDALPQTFLRRMVRGVSTRDYEGVIDLASEGFGVKKSSVSRGFVRASTRSLAAWSSRSLAGARYVAVFIDGVEYAGETLLVALGLTDQGYKQLLGLRQGATENAQVVTSLLEELVERGLETSRPTLFVLDGAKALVAGVKRVFGRQAVIQRCQVHKRRNVQAHLHERHHEELDRRLAEAYQQTNFLKARSALENTVRSAAPPRSRRRGQLGRGPAGNAHGHSSGLARPVASHPIQHQCDRISPQCHAHRDSASETLARRRHATTLVQRWTDAGRTKIPPCKRLPTNPPTPGRTRRHAT